MVKRFKKYDSGEGSRYLTRRAALQKLQLKLKDFRTLCIMKGIYPREPKHRRRAQKGKTGIQTLYLKKDIQFLLHEPMIWKLREKTTHLKRIKRAKSIKDYSMAKRYANTIPLANVDHILKERYPTFVDALRDMDDCLTLCFMYASMPRIKQIPSYLIALCRRLTIEFLHLVIAAKALRAVFVSIKGIYYQVELRGETITWLVNHNFCYEPDARQEVDFDTMTTFAEFYSTLLGFVNFRLYHVMNLCYPPQLHGYTTEDLECELIDDRVSLSEKVASLTIPLKRMGVSPEELADEAQLDEFPASENAELADKARQRYEDIRNLKQLFEGMKVFLNREVPRECLVFALRSFGAEVSWDKTSFSEGALFDEDNESITHQIVDRPDLPKKYISRFYVQPQWVFDSINARRLMPVEKYFMGVVLPPHLSPFAMEDTNSRRYVPPEERALKDPNYKPDENEDEKMDVDDEDLSRRVQDMLEEEKLDAVANGDSDDDEYVTDEDNDDDDNKNKNEGKSKQVKKMKVQPGETYVEDKRAKRKSWKDEKKLRISMIQSKNKHKFNILTKKRDRENRDKKDHKYKRKVFERQQKQRQIDAAKTMAAKM